ncbi:MAG TPA: Calx-beta domain-containing protein [Tepidisphaeraceae bacterium]|nr:Calx-beta domain-containing protein [Tepidisphaeraceae bacterium]
MPMKQLVRRMFRKASRDVGGVPSERIARAAAAGVDALESRVLFSVFTVTNNSDNTTSAPAGSLRWAINQSNNTGGVDTIAFNLPAGQRTIRPVGGLPGLWDPTILDATTQPGYAGAPLVQIDGASAGSVAGLQVYDGNTVKGLSITNFSGMGIEMFGRTNTGGSVIRGNWIGVDLSGAAAGNGGGIYTNTPNNTFGGPNVADRNVISGAKNGNGILIQGAGAGNNLVQGNYIGTDPTGTQARANAQNGVGVQFAPDNRILGNLLSGNGHDGIILIGGGADRNVVQGNLVGVNVSGTAALSNGLYGIEIQTQNNVIGGNLGSQRNVFSGNKEAGVVYFLSGATGNQTIGNYIGTDITGNVAIPNLQGIAFSNTTGANFVGNNLISGNLREGVGIFPGNNVTVQGNVIGFAASGANLVNQMWAVTMIGGATGNLIGGTGAGQGNYIANHPQDPDVYNGGTGNTVVGNVTTPPASTTVPGTFALSGAAYSAGEAAGTVTITVTRTAGTTVAASVNYATSNGTATAGSDYTAASGTLTFAAGETSKTFAVTILNDTAIEGGEAFSVGLSGATAGAALGTSSATVTINDDDVAVPGAFALSSAAYSLAENGGSATITVTRTAGTNVAASVNYATSNGTATSGSDYTAASGTLSFAAGETSKTFTVSVTNDSAIESNETIGLALSSPTNGATLGSQSTATLTINEDDVAVPGTFTLGAATYSAGEASGTLTITVNRTAGTNVAAGVNYTTANGTATAGNDYTAASGTLSFAAGETSKTLTVAILNDTAFEANETFTVGLSGATAGAAIGAPSSSTVTIVSDDAAPDTTPPRVTGVNFQYAGPPSKLTFTFSEDVSATLDTNGSDFWIIDEQFNGYTPMSAAWNAATKTATLTFDGALPKGTYTAHLFGQGVTDAAGNQLDGDNNGSAGGMFVYGFFQLPGDVDRNGNVGLNDLVLLSNNYGATSGMTYATGDLDGNGRVDLSDLVILSNNYGGSVSAPVAGTSLASADTAATVSSDTVATPVASTPTPTPVSNTPVATTTTTKTSVKSVVTAPVTKTAAATKKSVPAPTPKAKAPPATTKAPAPTPKKAVAVAPPTTKPAVGRSTPVVTKPAVLGETKDLFSRKRVA